MNSVPLAFPLVNLVQATRGEFEQSRRELVAHLFAEQYQPRIASGRDLDVNGWFT